jgi:hypothetical protein
MAHPLGPSWFGVDNVANPLSELAPGAESPSLAIVVLEAPTQFLSVKVESPNHSTFSIPPQNLYLLLNHNFILLSTTPSSSRCFIVSSQCPVLSPLFFNRHSYPMLMLMSMPMPIKGFLQNRSSLHGLMCCNQTPVSHLVSQAKGLTTGFF